MFQMLRQVSLLALCLVAFGWGCASTEPTTGPRQCEAGKTYQMPGCGDNNDFKAGCYATCTSDASCGAGEECRKATVIPECAQKTTGTVCDACGTNANLCLPSN